MSLRQQLQSIYETRGELTPQLVVDVARATDHELHDEFEWDDAVAGEKYRVIQAHELIRSVRVTYQKPDGSQESVRAFHAVRRDDNRQPTYTPIEELTENPIARQIVLADMRRDWATFKRRYETFAEFFELVRADLEHAAA